MQTLIQASRAYRLLQTQIQTNRTSHAYLVEMDDPRNLREAMKLFAKLFFGCDNPQNTREETVSRRIDSEQFSDCLFFPDEEKRLMVEDAERIFGKRPWVSRSEELLEPIEKEMAEPAEPTEPEVKEPEAKEPKISKSAESQESPANLESAEKTETTEKGDATEGGDMPEYAKPKAKSPRKRKDEGLFGGFDFDQDNTEQ